MLELSPLEVDTDGSTTPAYWLDTLFALTTVPAVPFGGGSITDDADTTGYNLQGRIETGSGGIQYGSAISGRFQADNAVAVLIKIRARIAPDAPPDPALNIVWTWRDGLADDYDATTFAAGNNNNDGGEFERLTGSFDWYTTGYGQDESVIDMANPTDAGFWVDCSLYPGMSAALAAGTLWLSFAAGTADASASLLSLLDVSELRLIVATSTGRFPLRRYPPVNNGGSGPTRHYPRAVNRRAGGTY